MAFPKIPYLKWRPQPDGSFRPRFVPGPRERALGFVGADLKDGERWFTVEEAVAWATNKLAEIKAARTGSPVKRPPTAKRERTVEALLDDWILATNPGRSPAQAERYRSHVRCLKYKPGAPGAEPVLEAIVRMPVHKLEPPELRKFWAYQAETRGLATAQKSMAMITAAWKWGTQDDFWRLLKVGPCPRSFITIDQPEPRVVVYTDVELKALIETADRMGWFSIGDAILLGVFTGQRQGDRINLVDEGLIDGRRRFRQRKTGVIVDVKEVPRLTERLAEARLRTIELRFKHGTVNDDDARTVVLSETNGKTWTDRAYRRCFARVRTEAAKVCPSVAGKTDQDLRDTCVTWLARAGCELPEIGAITGHGLGNIHNILKHYLAMTGDMADNAIDKLIRMMAKERMVV